MSHFALVSSHLPAVCQTGGGIWIGTTCHGRLRKSNAGSRWWGTTYHVQYIHQKSSWDLWSHVHKSHLPEIYWGTWDSIYEIDMLYSSFSPPFNQKDLLLKWSVNCFIDIEIICIYLSRSFLICMPGTCVCALPTWRVNSGKLIGPEQSTPTAPRFVTHGWDNLPPWHLSFLNKLYHKQCCENLGTFLKMSEL